MSSEANNIFQSPTPFGLPLYSAPGTTLTVNYGSVSSAKPSKEQPMSEKDQVVNDLRRLAEKGEDINAISKEFDSIKVARKQRIMSGLKGTADLAIMGKPEGSRFILAYFKDNEARTVEGVDYAKDQYISDNDELRVYLHGDDHPVSDEFYSMKALKKALDEHEIPYHIAYFD